MKTKEEVVAHLLDNGYTNRSISKIMGFLLGANLKEIDEVLKVKKGDGTFDDFYEWFNSDDDDILFNILNDIAERCDESKSAAEKNRYIRQMSFLLDAFDIKLEDSDLK